MVEYISKIEEDGECSLSCGDYRVATLYFNSKRCNSPLTRKQAEKILQTIVAMVEECSPSSELDDEQFTSEFDEKDFFEMLLRGAV